MTTPFKITLLLGALLRLACLPLPGTEDVRVWKTWAYAGATAGPSVLYGIGGTPPERRLLGYKGRSTVVDYPPMALDALALVGSAYALVDPEFADETLFTIAIKIPLVLAEAALAWLIFVALRRWHGGAAARFACSAYWLNPATILDASALGYLDPLFALPALAALVAAASGHVVLLGCLLGIAALTKVQAILIVPVVGLLLWNAAWRRRPAISTAVLSLVATMIVVVAPVAVAGGGRNMAQALVSLGRHDMLSGYAANLWWVVTYVMRAVYATPSLGALTAWTMHVRILAISTVTELGYPNPRVIGLLLVLSVWAWTLWRHRMMRDLVHAAAVGGFLVHAYYVLSAQVHENHLYLALPLVALAAARWPPYRPLFWMISAVFALNLNLFYGLSEGLGYAVPRGVTLVDATVVLAVLNIALFARHAQLLERFGRLAPGFLAERQASVTHREPA
ncbi:MAG: hypothetical protein HYX76_04590 [Acidobacteria bacterium]|nr:hypothetical protein [Acidobacteriota bacterium]